MTTHCGFVDNLTALGDGKREVRDKCVWGPERVCERLAIKRANSGRADFIALNPWFVLESSAGSYPPSLLPRNPVHKVSAYHDMAIKLRARLSALIIV